MDLCMLITAKTLVLIKPVCDGFLNLIEKTTSHVTYQSGRQAVCLPFK